MGIDAEMFVKLNYKITEEELRQKSYIFGSMCKYHLFLGYNDTHIHNPLESVKSIHSDGNGARYNFHAKDGSLIKVPLAGRYYGPDYERGPLLDYVAIALFLEIIFPDGEIYYGGDSSGVEFELFDSKYRNELMQHAAKVAHEPYNRCFNGNHTKYVCPHCKVPMIQNGFKGKLGYFHCVGCNWSLDEISEHQTKSGYNLQMSFVDTIGPITK